MFTTPFKVPGLNTYFGGKGGSGTYQQIINQIRPHDVFISGFLGNCAIMRHKLPARLSYGLDASHHVIQAWQQVQMPGLVLQNRCSIEYLQNYFPAIPKTQKAVVFLDPPYPLNSRKHKKPVYECEMTDEQHFQLLQAAKALPCDVLICTYKNELYEAELKDWRLIKYVSATRRGPATEYLYLNYSNPEGLLHDYRYIGRDYRERERIAKKINRHVERLKQLPSYERNAILTALQISHQQK